MGGCCPCGGRDPGGAPLECSGAPAPCAEAWGGRSWGGRAGAPCGLWLRGAEAGAGGGSPGVRAAAPSSQGESLAGRTVGGPSTGVPSEGGPSEGGPSGTPSWGELGPGCKGAAGARRGGGVRRGRGVVEGVAGHIQRVQAGSWGGVRLGAGRGDPPWEEGAAWSVLGRGYP